MAKEGEATVFGDQFELWERSIPPGGKERAAARRIFPVLARMRDWTRYRSVAEPHFQRFLENNRIANEAALRRAISAGSGPVLDKLKYQAKGDEKFIFMEPWFVDKLRFFCFLNLHDQPPLRMLDLGCAMGQFQLLGEACGHESWGVDIPSPVFDDLCPRLDLKRIVRRIDPDFWDVEEGEPFDLITAFLVNFNIQKDGVALWDAGDWERFLTGLRQRLSPGGRFLMLLNPQQAHGGLRAADHSLPRFLAERGFSVSGIDNRALCLYRAPAGADAG